MYYLMLLIVLFGADVVQADRQGKVPEASYVSIPAGTFWMGCNKQVDSECCEEEKPYHEVYLDAFLIGKTEVTVSQYDECVAEGACTVPDSGDKYCLGKYAKYANWGKAGKEDHPMNCVSWHQAKEYCEWAGGSLCTEAQWEKAARGTDGRKYPWGNAKASCTYAVTKEGGVGCGTGGTMAVGSKPKGASPYGALDMAGNVWEWVDDWYHKSYYSQDFVKNPLGPIITTYRVIRGGSFYSDDFSLRASIRSYGAPSDGSFDTGIRCCKAP